MVLVTSYEAARASTRLLVPRNRVPAAAPSLGWGEAVVGGGGVDATVGAGGVRDQVRVAGPLPGGWRRIGGSRGRNGVAGAEGVALVGRASGGAEAGVCTLGAAVVGSSCTLGAVSVVVSWRSCGAAVAALRRAFSARISLNRGSVGMVALTRACSCLMPSSPLLLCTPVIAVFSFWYARNFVNFGVVQR